MADVTPVVSEQEVYDLLRATEYNDGPWPVHWVMNLEWYKAIRRTFLRDDDAARDEAEWEPQPADMFLGYYITVTEDGGRPYLAGN
jgi:hypothetical protein